MPHLNFLGRDGGVSVDELGHDASEGLDTQRQGGHVQQQNVLHGAPQHAALRRRSKTPPMIENK